MKEFVETNGGLLITISTIALAINLFLSGLSKGLEVMKDKTKTDVDNKIFNAINKAIAVLQKIVDWTSGNRQHK